MNSNIHEHIVMIEIILSRLFKPILSELGSLLEFPTEETWVEDRHQYVEETSQVILSYNQGIKTMVLDIMKSKIYFPYLFCTN